MLCFYICYVLLFQYSIASPPDRSREFDVLFNRWTESGNLIEPPYRLRYPAGQPLTPPSRPAGPDNHPPLLQLPPIQYHHPQANSPSRPSQVQSSLPHGQAGSSHQREQSPHHHGHARPSASGSDSHQQAEQIPAGGAKKPQNICMACGKVYDQRGVISHLKREGEVEEIDNNGKKRYKCKICPKALKIWTPKTMMRHIRDKHRYERPVDLHQLWEV